MNSIKLFIDNSECRIEGLNIQQHDALKELLSYETEPQLNYHTRKYFKTQKFLIDKHGKFPTGLLYLVDSFLAQNGIIAMRRDFRKKPQSGTLFKLNLSLSPYPEQVAAAKTCKEHSRGIVVAPTGVGKSLIASLIINELQVRTLVVVPSLELKRQLSKSLAEAFGSSIVGEGLPIWVENVDALDTKTCITGYDCVIIDEFHHSGAATYRKLNKKAWSKVYFKIGLTATPHRSRDTERLLLESVLSKVIYRIDYQTAVRKDYIVPMEAYHYELPKTPYEGYTWAEVYKELVVNNSSRNGIISSLMRSLIEAKIPTLCLVKEISHGEVISELSGAPFANGLNEDTPNLIKAFNRGKIPCLIGTTGILGEGVDTKPAEFIIVAGLGKSRNSLMQQFGRGFRKYPNKGSCKVILFHDRSHKWTKEHFKTQVKILLEEYNIESVRLSLPESK